MTLRRICLFIILGLAGAIGIYELKGTAQIVPTTCLVTVPVEWGEFKGISKFGLVFEDKAGTLRLIDQMPCSVDKTLVAVPTVAVEVRRK